MLGQNVTKLATINMSYGPAVSLEFTTPERSQYAQHPSSVLSIRRVNQYGKVVPVYSDTRIYLRSTSGTGEFSTNGSTNWGINYVTMLNSNSSVSFYYRDRTEGRPLLTAADLLPLTPDQGLTNATQYININRQILDHLFVTNISDPQKAGTPSSVVVMARDADGYIVPWYDGTINFTSDDPNAIIPTSYTFDPALDKGSHTFTNEVAFTTPGEKIVTATDSTYGVSGSQTDITVEQGNTAPVKSLIFSQPESPAKFIINKASPAITLQLIDADGNPTNAPVTGFPVHLTTTSETALFSLSASGPWVSTLDFTIPAGLSFLNFHYKDNVVSTSIITGKDWLNQTDDTSIDNANLEVFVGKVGLTTDYSIYSQNVFGNLEESKYIFAHDQDGNITGRSLNSFNAFNLETNLDYAVLWRSYWRQGVNLLETTNPSLRTTSIDLNKDSFTTIAGRPDFYAIAEATDELNFNKPEAVVSIQNTIPTSPWKLGLEDKPYAIVDQSYSIDISSFKSSNLSSAPELLIQVLPSNATDASTVLYGETISNAPSTYNFTIPVEDILSTEQLGNKYRIFVTAVDENGDTIAQALSSPFEVVERIPDPEPPVDPPDPETPETPEQPNKPTPEQPNNPTPETPTPETPITPTPPTPEQPNKPTPEQPNPELPTPPNTNTAEQIILNSATTILSIQLFIGIVALIREAYREVKKVRDMRNELKRLKTIAKEKLNFLRISTHYLRTPISTIEAALGISTDADPVLRTVYTSLHNKSESILNRNETGELSLINDPDVKRATRSALFSLYFWLPIFLSVALTIALNRLLNAWVNQEITNIWIPILSIALTAAILITFFTARHREIKREQQELEDTTNKARAILFNSQENFVKQLEDELWNDITLLKSLTNPTNTSNNPTNTNNPNASPINSIIENAIYESSRDLEFLTMKFSILALLNGAYDTTNLTKDNTNLTNGNTNNADPNSLITTTLKNKLNSIKQKNLYTSLNLDPKLNSKLSPKLKLRLDQRLLSYTLSNLLDHLIETADQGDTLSIHTTISHKQLSLTFKDNTPLIKHPNYQTIFNNPEDINGYEKQSLNLYLDKLILNHLNAQLEQDTTKRALRVRG